jgi:hypothetical protein
MFGLVEGGELELLKVKSKRWKVGSRKMEVMDKKTGRL